jgi:hypothetical protein
MTPPIMLVKRTVGRSGTSAAVGAAIIERLGIAEDGRTMAR